MNSNVLAVFFLAGILVSYASLNVGEERNEAKSQGKKFHCHNITSIIIEVVSIMINISDRHASLPLKRAI